MKKYSLSKRMECKLNSKKKEKTSFIIFSKIKTCDKYFKRQQRNKMKKTPEDGKTSMLGDWKD